MFAVDVVVFGGHRDSVGVCGRRSRTLLAVVFLLLL